MVCNPISIFIYLLAFTSTTGNLTVLFAFISNAISRVLQPLDRITVNMALVNLLLPCYKEVPAVPASVFGERGCGVPLYTYHMLRLISIWSVEDLSFLHLIKFHRPNHHWSKFIYRHQRQYVHSTLAGCWIFSIISQLPYLQYNTRAKRMRLLKHNFENSILYGVLSCIYYSSSSSIIVFGYMKVRRLTEACWCLRCKTPTIVQSVEIQRKLIKALDKQLGGAEQRGESSAVGAALYEKDIQKDTTIFVLKDRYNGHPSPHTLHGFTVHQRTFERFWFP
ncbi:LOW QUALITY PROTEIN: uncharacterized protein O3Q21_015956 [Podargus strigoides]